MSGMIKKIHDQLGEMERVRTYRRDRWGWFWIKTEYFFKQPTN
jgi:hypothetical protein